MARAKAKTAPEREAGFFFLGNQLALDFINTRPVINGQPVELLVDLAALLRWFAAAGLLSSREVVVLRRRWEKSEHTERALIMLRSFRERLRQAVTDWEQGKSISRPVITELNGLLATHPMLTRVSSGKNGPETSLWFEPHGPADLIAPIAHSAAALFAGVDSRVRKCANCVLHFYDTSKKGTRRWCSMLLCGNRFKVAAYAARQRSEE
jgi:predicted RNA-binding Zn ribbon-like protein